jgi:rRNA maturation protein Nop10
MCHSESDGEECLYCASPTVEVDNIYELRYTLRCNECGAMVEKKADSDKNDMLAWGFWHFRACPVCNKRTMHEIIFRGASLTSYDSYLEHAYKQELEKG